MVSARVVFAIVAVFFVLALSVDAAYRKPPFNGSIFGKRSGTNTDYELAIRAISSMCETACETCNIWLSRQDSN
ncbi:SIFamide-related peptide [Ceratina calcarata]|uniref:SIFamide-related peptide n=1 Tax=Ceratina calcarata TaxID=156304 RepID=A0AAJ7NCK3_9HYME|nr:SIFamide-related peptide [Ceratina calcarata]XP_026673565.1 SIFamide-related peptide [Ceratina calcarata]